MAEKLGSWTTSNEKNFIDGLITGKWIEYSSKEINRKKLLVNYIQGAKKRQGMGTFGKVNASEVILYARNRLKSIQESEKGKT